MVREQLFGDCLVAGKQQAPRIASRIGNADHVHIGSDFDGCSVPDDIKDISTMPTFFTELKERLGLDNQDIKKIQYENVERILKAILT